MNANDHVPMVNIMPFGFCKKGMPCMPLTPLAWVDVNKKHIIDGAPALTEDSKLACAHGGVITIVPLDAGSAEEGDRNENAEDSVERLAMEALAFAGSLAGKGKGKLVKNLTKMSAKKDGVKNNKGNRSNSVENSGAASNRSLENGSGNGEGGISKAKKEVHHITTDKSKKFDFKNHPAFKETGIDVSKDIDNLVELAGHKGRHTNVYHQEVQRRLDAVYERFGGTDKLESAVRKELKNMREELLEGTLNPYGK